jgi:hypothetical protein
VDLHPLDRYWWQHDGGLHRKVKERRRRAHRGTCALSRDADDWRRLTNGRKAEAQRVREEGQRFLWDERRLELSVEKTPVTQVNDGFDCLGLHIRRDVGPRDRPKLLSRPSRTAPDRRNAKGKELTARRRFRDTPRRKTWPTGSTGGCFAGGRSGTGCRRAGDSPATNNARTGAGTTGGCNTARTGYSSTG